MQKEFIFYDNKYFIVADVNWPEPHSTPEVAVKTVKAVLSGVEVDITEASVKHKRFSEILESKVRKEFRRQHRWSGDEC